MNGIILINERGCLHNLSKSQRIELQKEAIETYIEEMKIHPVKLNPSQTNNYYTIPHALLYDLKRYCKVQLDCLVIYSEEVITDFIYSYPAKWLLLKGFFNEVHFADQQRNRFFKSIG